MQEKLRIMNFGDSVQWGQGLYSSDKFIELVREELENSYGSVVEIVGQYAHSGGKIGFSSDTKNGTSFPLDGIDGEIPRSDPSMNAQLSSLEVDSAISLSDVDLVLINGGANDSYEGKSLLWGWVTNPTCSVKELREVTEIACYTRMKELLIRVANAMPNAAIIVTGYYPIVSLQSSESLAAIAIAAIVSSVVGLSLAVFFEAGIIELLAERSTAWAATSTAALMQAIDEIKTEVGGSSRLAFAELDFSAENCLSAPSAWLWGIGAPANSLIPDLKSLSWGALKTWIGDLGDNFNLFEPQDPLGAKRKAECGDDFVCWWASVGHPNPDGAKHICEKILPAFERCWSSIQDYRQLFTFAIADRIAGK